MSHPALVFDFEVGQVQFGLAPGDQADMRAALGEAYGKTFPDAPAGAGDQDIFMIALLHPECLPPVA